MAYILPEKARSLSAYQPIEGTYKIRLDANESFLQPAAEDIEKIACAVTRTAFNRYPDPAARAVCGAFADSYKVDPALVTAGNGSDELIFIILSAFIQKGDKVLTLAPDFDMYRIYASLVEADCIVMQKNEAFQVDIDQMIKTVQDKDIKLVIFSNPCNPTSLGRPADEIRRLAQETSALIVLDEAYMDFWDQSLLPEIEAFTNVIILRTCSKAIGLAALRMGFAVACPALTGVLRAAKSPYNVNSVSQDIARIILENPCYKKEYIEKILRSRDTLMNALRPMEKDGRLDRIYGSRTNFVCISTPRAAATAEALRGMSIAVKAFGHRFLRITCGAPEENRALVQGLESIL